MSSGFQFNQNKMIDLGNGVLIVCPFMNLSPGLLNASEGHFKGERNIIFLYLKEQYLYMLYLNVVILVTRYTLALIRTSKAFC